MKISRERLLGDAQATGFRPEVLEKVLQLLGLLEGFQSHPFLKDRLALKGGTALNLFVFDVPRLSVDIDLNYVGAVDREKMMEERPKLEQAVQDVCGREGVTVARQPGDHAGGKWRLRYDSSMGEGGNLELDLNYMFRMPLWPIVRQDSHAVGSSAAREIPVLDIHELTAGKLAALLSRHASRDLFDVHQLLRVETLDPQKLRLGFVLYGAMNRKDWRTVSTDDVNAAPRELEHQLLPVMRSGLPEEIGGLAEWAAQLVEETRQKLQTVLPFTDNEVEFLNRLLDHGEIDATLLVADEEMLDRIQRHPLLQWKALNVRQHQGHQRG